MEREERSLATEMLAELKENSKRWFRVAVIELGLILLIITMFIGYLMMPVEEEMETITYTQDADTEGDGSPINQSIGEW